MVPSMNNVFIGWGGNQSLAYEIKNILQSDKNNIIVGGGSPTDIFVGAQVIDQINQCNCAILLVEDYNGHISPNLLFEWGYILANRNIRNRNIQIFLIDKSPRDLPSDLLGVWATEMKRDRSCPDSDKKLATEICEKYLQASMSDFREDYFSIVNEWTALRQNFSEKNIGMSEREFEEYAVMGCLAAYYYNDNKYLRAQLNNITGSSEFNSVIQFAKAYIDVFLTSHNMSKPIPTPVFFNSMSIFEQFLSMVKNSEDNFKKIEEILCYDVYGLACTLYLKNEDLDDDTKRHCRDKALECFENTLELTDKLEQHLQHNKCLIQLIRAYIYNDTAHLYQKHYNDNERFLKYLDLSVAARKELHSAFSAKYPTNTFFANKLEQEYMIALSEQCLYMENGFQKALSISTIKSKYDEWKIDVDYVYSLIKRLENNLKELTKL